MEKLASIDELEGYVGRTNAQISQFQKRLQTFDEEYTKHVGVLLSYDEVLCEKASKVQVDLTKAEVQ